MTTGGGWQDQVNGLLPGGFKLGVSEASETKVKVDTAVIRKNKKTTTSAADSASASEEEEEKNDQEFFLKQFESHLVLIYTGKVRLAKNLLQVSTTSK